MGPVPVRVLIADDHRSFATAVEAILSVEPRIEVVGRASSGREAVALDAELEPDVVLMDISMPDLDGIEATRLIRRGRPRASVLVLTGSDAAADFDAARQAGAAGYVTKDQIAIELVGAILEIADR
jgi:DNA-binding NarL/FixJ family response regulator